MSREEVMRLMAEVRAGRGDLLPRGYENFVDVFERFAELVAKHEREMCLEIADQCADADMNAAMAANAIRARSKQ